MVYYKWIYVNKKLIFNLTNQYRSRSVRKQNKRTHHKFQSRHWQFNVQRKNEENIKIPNTNYNARFRTRLIHKLNIGHIEHYHSDYI